MAFQSFIHNVSEFRPYDLQQDADVENATMYSDDKSWYRSLFHGVACQEII